MPNHPAQFPANLPNLAPKLAAIDVGSNSIRLLVAEAEAGELYRVVHEERESTRLGRSLASSRRLDDQSIADSLAALRRFQSIAAEIGVQDIRVIATCAVREAENGPELCSLARQQLNLPIEVISAEQEAYYAFDSVRRRLDLTGKNSVLADVGGGSTEIVVAAEQSIVSMHATPLGAVRLCEKFGGGQSPIGEDYEQMLAWIDHELEQSTQKPAAPCQLLIGSGGTFTSLAAIIRYEKRIDSQEGPPRGESDPGGVGIVEATPSTQSQAGIDARDRSPLTATGEHISRADVRDVIDRLREMTPCERREVPGLFPDRIHIIVPGMAVVERIMHRFDVNLLQEHPYGVRDGLLLSMFDQVQGETC